MKYNISISGTHYRTIREHLYPGDGKEAVVIALCGRHQYKDDIRLLVYEVIPIPYNQCYVRDSLIVKWSTKIILPFLEKAQKKNFAVLKIHSHPSGFPDFSETDDESDIELFDSVYGWMDSLDPHASAIMFPDGRVIGRIITPELKFSKISRISISGEDIKIWDSKRRVEFDEFELRNLQTFGEGTTQKLKKLKVGVIGCSGTGSPVIEQLVRLGVGHLVLIDPDRMEEKNLNRILNSTIKHAHQNEYKVDVIAQAIDNIGLGTRITKIKENLYDSLDTLNELACCDVIFGCLDSVDGRHYLNLLSTFYLIPYFDLGVKLISDGEGGIDQIMGTIHYIQPGGSSLRTRGVYNDEDLRAAAMYRRNVDEYNLQKRSGYIVDVNVDSPAVISINMQIASMAVNEFLARIHPYKYDSNKMFAVSRISFTDSYFQNEEDGEADLYLRKYVGRGYLRPPLNMPDLIKQQENVE